MVPWNFVFVITCSTFFCIILGMFTLIQALISAKQLITPWCRLNYHLFADHTRLRLWILGIRRRLRLDLTVQNTVLLILGSGWPILFLYARGYMRVYAYAFMCVFVCVGAFVCVCVCVRDLKILYPYLSQLHYHEGPRHLRAFVYLA